MYIRIEEIGIHLQVDDTMYCASHGRVWEMVDHW